jgi:YD repeat-containing protein
MVTGASGRLHRITEVTSDVLGDSWLYGYDNLGRLTSATNPVDGSYGVT